MIIELLAVSLTLILGMVCSVFAQSDDIGSVLDKAQKSLDNQQSESDSVNKDETTLSEGFKAYESKKFGIKMQYPQDWSYDERTGPVEDRPDELFTISFTSPPNKNIVDVVYAWFTIEKLKDKISLEERKNTIYDNLNRFPEITQKIVQSPTELSGLAAFRTDYFSPGLGQNDIDIETINNDFLYTLTFTSEPDTLNKHMTSIQKMMDTVQITPADETSIQSSKSTSSSPSTSTTPPKTSTPKSDEQDNCDSSYPDFCIPSPPPNLNCPDISQKRFTVSGSDPHGFDRDNDGVGCES
jgi:hypothetical protein